MTSLLAVDNIVKHFPLSGGDTVRAVNGVSLAVDAGEVLCVVGESGCGKSTLARVIIGLLRPTSGEVHYNGERVDNLNANARRPYRRAMQIIFQNPYESLNPRMTTKQILEEAVRFHFPDLSASARLDACTKALRETGLDTDALTRYPHQFSGGQRQRISIARALIVKPQCIIADEPVAALDVSVRAQILNLLSDLREQHNLAYFFITHDLSVVEYFGHRVAVMYLGMVCETATCQDLFAAPRHPYTRILLQAAPKIGKPLLPPKMPGEPPTPLAVPTGCSFHPRCPHATERCRRERPQLKTMENNIQISCHAVEEGRI